MGKRHRFTVKELEEMTDANILTIVLTDRMESCANVNTKLYKRLSAIQKKVYDNWKPDGDEK